MIIFGQQDFGRVVLDDGVECGELDDERVDGYGELIDFVSVHGVKIVKI